MIQKESLDLNLQIQKSEKMIEDVEELIDQYISSLDSYSYELFQKLPQGKRLRSKLILKIAGESQKSNRLAAIIELIHAASLLHDDVIDDALQRRGVDSINAIYGNKSAIMLGDILYSKAYLELVEFDKEIAKIISDAVTKLSIGELLDVKMSEVFNEDEGLYFDMIYKKTAVLIEASAKSAALLSNKDSSAYALYGKNLGLAFQIIDDILDITQDSKTLGKPSMSDFEEGKTTLPYIYLYHSLDDENKRRLKELFKKSLDEKELAWIKQKMIESGAIDLAIKKARKLGSEALKVIESDKNEELERVIRDMIERTF